MTENQKLRVFFSWQSDLDDDVTTKPIRRALKDAVSAMDDHDVDVVVSEATSNSPGSPYIPGEIAEKIRNSDVFIGDITPVAISAKGKKCPNSNVTLELGLAAAHLGWNRVIMLINKDISDLKELPFDFDRHRISQFSVRTDENKKADIRVLTQLLVAALKLIVAENPKRPRELENRPEGEIRRERDLRNIRWFMRNMSTNVLDAHVEQMPGHLDVEAVHISDGLSAVVASSEFHLFDTELEAIMRDLQLHLHQTVSYDQFYRETASWMRRIFGGIGYDNKTRKRETAAFEAITAARDLLKEDIRRLLSALRQNYLEIDVDATNRLSQAEFLEMHRELLKG